jgi:RsiW-degrading membrane proteinase PrsW (M82 family)
MAVEMGAPSITVPRPLPWARAPARRYVGDALWAAAIALAVAILLATDTWPILWQQLSFLIGLAVLTYPVRSVRWGTVYNFFLFGLVWGFVIVGVQYLLEMVLLGGRVETFRSAVLAPLTEEPLKVAPLLLAFLVARWRFRHSYGASDLMLLAGALGAGFGFFENSLHGHPFPGTPVSPKVLGFTVFPDSIDGFIGHGAASAMIGLTLGYLIYALRWKRLAPWGVAAVLLSTLWVMADHGLANYRASSAEMFFLFRWVWALDGQGTWTPYLFFALILLTIAAERVVLSRVLRPFPRLGLRQSLAAVRAPLRRGYGYGEVRAATMRAKTILLYVLAYRQLGYLGAHLKGDTPVDREAIAESVMRRTAEIVAAQRAVRLS